MKKLFRLAKASLCHITALSLSMPFTVYAEDLDAYRSVFDPGTTMTKIRRIRKPRTPPLIRKLHKIKRSRLATENPASPHPNRADPEKGADQI